MMKIKLNTTHYVLCALLLSSCGFGTEDADPMADRDEVLVSAIEKDAEVKLWKQRCEEIEADYTLSLGAHRTEVGRLNQEFARDLKANQDKYKAAVVRSEQEFVAVRDSFVGDTNRLRVQCDSIQKTLQNLIQTQQVELSKYRKQAETFDAQEFGGYLWNFDAIQASPQSYVFVDGEQKSIALMSNLTIREASEAFMGLDFYTKMPGTENFVRGLPAGLMDRRRGESSTFVISGAPQVQFDGMSEVVIDVAVLPRVDYTKIENKAIVEQLRRESRRYIQLIVKKSTRKPEVVDVQVDASATNPTVQIKVMDPGSREMAPTLRLFHDADAGNTGMTVLNALAVMTMSPGENPKKVGSSEWVYTYELHKSLVDQLAEERENNGIPFKSKVVATFKAHVQSRVTGLESNKAHLESISIEGGK